jgi:hypothetical protein
MIAAVQLEEERRQRWAYGEEKKWAARVIKQVKGGLSPPQNILFRIFI